jgi:hypothetical protein
MCKFSWLFVVFLVFFLSCNDSHKIEKIKENAIVFSTKIEESQIEELKFELNNIKPLSKYANRYKDWRQNIDSIDIIFERYNTQMNQVEKYENGEVNKTFKKYNDIELTNLYHLVVRDVSDLIRKQNQKDPIAKIQDMENRDRMFPKYDTLVSVELLKELGDDYYKKRLIIRKFSKELHNEILERIYSIVFYNGCKYYHNTFEIDYHLIKNMSVVGEGDTLIITNQNIGNFSPLISFENKDYFLDEGRLTIPIKAQYKAGKYKLEFLQKYTDYNDSTITVKRALEYYVIDKNWLK